MKKLGRVMFVALFGVGTTIARLGVGTTIAAADEQSATSPLTAPYGAPIGLDAAKKLMGAAEAEAAKSNRGVAIAIVDSTGQLVMLHKMDNAHSGSTLVAGDKARTSLEFKRPSKAFEDLVAKSGIDPRTLTLQGATPLEGGLPIIVDDKIIGAIGVAGATTAQDGYIAKAGTDAAK